MTDVAKFIDKTEGFGSLVLYSTLPILITHEAFWIEFLIGAGKFLVEQGIRYGLRIRKFKRQILPLIEELFTEGLQEERRETVVGLRYESKPSEWDYVAATRSFSVPFVLKFGGQIKRKLTRQPRLPSSEMSPIFVGGWRPIREVELILRETPFIFGILRDNGKVYVPSKDELEDIRRDPNKVLRWRVCEVEGNKVKKWWSPEYRQDGRPKSDLVILTRGTNPLNPRRKALAISGTHREGTLGGALLTSTPELLKEFYKLPGLNKYLSAQYQVAARLYFNEFSLNDPKSLEVRKVELLGGSKL